MTARSEVWALLAANEGRWVSRAEIEKVGGAESMRRLREVRTAALASEFTFEQRQTIGTLLEYRLVNLHSHERSPWRCTKCGAPRSDLDLQPSTDARDRYRLGPCAVCSNKHAIFRKEP